VQTLLPYGFGRPVERSVTLALTASEAEVDLRSLGDVRQCQRYYARPHSCFVSLSQLPVPSMRQPPHSETTHGPTSLIRGNAFKLAPIPK
jgi:hypothetical protein